MDEAAVRSSAQQHADATVAGDLKVAGSTLDKSAYGAAGEVMKKMPQSLTGCEIVSTVADGDDYVVTIRYEGDGSSATVESRWAEREGQPKIVDLKAL